MNNAPGPFVGGGCCGGGTVKVQAGFLYFGNPETEGTIRWGVVDGDFVTQQLQGGVWVTLETYPTPLDGPGFFGVGDDCIYKSIDAGNTYGLVSSLQYIRLISIAGSDGHMVAVQVPSGDASQPARILTSDDYGSTWTDRGIGHADMVYLSGICRSDTGRLFISGYQPGGGVGGGVIFKSDDLGLTWDIAHQWNGVTSPYNCGIVNCGSGNICAVGAGATLDCSYSADDGETWTDGGTGSSTIFAAVPLPAGYVAFVTAVGIDVQNIGGDVVAAFDGRFINAAFEEVHHAILAVSDNGGVTFATMRTLDAAGTKPPRSLAMFSVSNILAYLTPGPDVWQSVDLGANWTLFSEGGPLINSRSVTVVSTLCATAGGNALGEASPGNCILLTQDAGATWNNMQVTDATIYDTESHGIPG